MWNAFIRATGAAAAATTMVASHASHGAVSGVRHTGQCVVHTLPAAQTANATASATSTFEIDCVGSRRNGWVISNGAASARSATPRKAAAGATAAGSTREAMPNPPAAIGSDPRATAVAGACVVLENIFVWCAGALRTLQDPCHAVV